MVDSRKANSCSTAGFVSKAKNKASPITTDYWKKRLEKNWQQSQKNWK